MAGARAIWKGVVRQGGGVPVIGFEAWVDLLMGFSLLSSHLGDRVAIISGPGGLAVSAAEACGYMVLKLVELSPDTKATLAEFVPPTGTSLRNPVDVGLSAYLEMDIYIQAARAIAADPGVDVVVVVGAGMTPESNQLYTESMIQTQKDCQKAFIIVGIPGFDSNLAQQFCQAGIPFFDSAERAMRTYPLVRQYHLWRQEIAEQPKGEE